MKFLTQILPLMKPLIFAVTIVLFFLANDVFAQSSKAVALYEQGKKAYDDDEYDEAISAFKKAIAKEENYTDAVYYLGLSYYYDNQYEQAVETFSKLESIDAAYWAWYLYARAYSYEKLGMADLAIADYRLFLDRFPKEPNRIKLHHQAKFKIDYLLGRAELEKQPPTMKEPVNLGSSINTISPEYFPQIDPTGKKLYFTSQRKSRFSQKDGENNKWGEDLYVIERQGDAFGAPKLMAEPINSTNNEGTATFSGDGQTMVFVRCGADGGIGSCDLYTTHLEGDTWGKPVNIGNVVNSEKWDSQPCLSADGTKIVFTSSRTGGYGGYDLYLIEKNKFGDWGIPQNMGPIINTPWGETNPFLAPDSKTLYFSSYGHPGFGGKDLFMSTFENGLWSKPLNLGRPLNSEADDSDFSISASGEYAFFASEREGGVGADDLYQIELPEALRPQAIVIVSGVVTDEKEQKPLSAWVLIEDLNTGDLIATNKSNSKTGEYMAVLPAGRNYAVTANRKGYFFYSQNFEVTKESQYQELKKDITLKPIEKGTRVVLNNVFFDTGKATLSPESRLDLDKAIDLMDTNPTMKIEVGGHTDNTGNDDTNLRLSHERAKSVRQYFIAAGIASARIEAKGYGETTPIADNDTEEGRAANRRTEFIILEF
jgi:outer membrane protein OmpA-like peptidoglycan-associated protein